MRWRTHKQKRVLLRTSLCCLLRSDTTSPSSLVVLLLATVVVSNCRKSLGHCKALQVVLRPGLMCVLWNPTRLLAAVVGWAASNPGLVRLIRWKSIASRARNCGSRFKQQRG